MNKLFVMVVAILLSCSSIKKMDPASNASLHNPLPAFDVQGHRGCRGLMPENTWPAFRLALDLNVNTLEMDAVITKDGQVVLSHEPWFSYEITTTPDGAYIKEAEEKALNIYNMTYAEVQRFDVGLKPHPRFPKQQKIKAVKPLLSAVMDSVKSYMVSARRAYPFYNIEIKSTPDGDNIYHPNVETYVNAVMAVIEAKKMEAQVVIQSFDVRPLLYLHKKYPSIKTALLVEDFDKKPLQQQLEQLQFIPTVYSPHFSLVNADLVQQCHQKNIRLIPWTVNEKATIDSLKKMGVDGIITDYPNIVF